MAEINSNEGGKPGRKGSPSQKKRSTRVDMTAMVDVAFLLLTFFILTTTLAAPEGIYIAKPPMDRASDPPSTTKVHDDRVMTMILGADDQVHYFHGMFDPLRFETTDFGEGGIRQVIATHLQRHANLCKDGDDPEDGCWNPVFVVKPNASSRYKNLVDALDELRIAGARIYSYTEVTPSDEAFLAQAGKE